MRQCRQLAGQIIALEHGRGREAAARIGGKHARHLITAAPAAYRQEDTLRSKDFAAQHLIVGGRSGVGVEFFTCAIVHFRPLQKRHEVRRWSLGKKAA